MHACMRIGVTKETSPGERRVALVPELVPKLTALGLEVNVEIGAGIQAGFPDGQYTNKGAHLRERVLEESDIILKVRRPSDAEIASFRPSATIIGLLEPYSNIAAFELMAKQQVSAFAMELMPRIARAQPMDAISAMSTVAGYKAVLLAANQLPKFFPLFDDRGRNNSSGPGLRSWRRSRWTGSDRHGEAAWSSRRGLRHAAGGERRS